MRYLQVFVASVCAGLCLTFVACGGRSSPPATQRQPATRQNTEAAFAHSHRHTPPHPPVQSHTVTAADRAASAAAGWQRVMTAAPFAAGAFTPLLMTDGTVMIQDSGSNWYSLTPDINGRYADGRWSQKASLPNGYAPLYYASGMLPDGRLIITGGEYNFGALAESSQGAIYDPVENTWLSVPPPPGWSSIGDVPSAVLADGTYMIGRCCGDVTQAQYNESTATWTIVGAGKGSANDEEGWTLLPSGDLLSINVSNAPGTELFSPATNAWSPGQPTPVNLVEAGGEFLGDIGPQLLRYNGTVFAAGANGYTVVYSLASGTWSMGPSFPIEGGVQLDVDDGPAALLVDGNILIPASPGAFNTPATYFIFNGTTLNKITGPPNAVNDSSYNTRLLGLPNGQVLETDGTDDVEIYTPAVMPDSSIAPLIASVPAKLIRGKTYSISGYRFNGNSQADAYGDDAQEATNFPLVQIVNKSTGHVFFARTHDYSSMAVDSPMAVSARFDVPIDAERGQSHLFVIANGIKSTAVKAIIK